LGERQAAALTVGTFHHLCALFLRRDIVHLGRARDFVIYDADDQERLIRQVLKDLNLDEQHNPPRAILSQISSAKNELLTPEAYAQAPERASSYREMLIARCYQRYQQVLGENNALDFDDLLCETLRLFDQHPPVLASYQHRYTHILVDEYQDTNRAQYLLVRQLATLHRNLFVVGDEDQSVYSWRGADVRNILQFEDDYPDAEVILLEQNYRSTRAILDVAQAIIRRGTTRKHLKHLWTQNEAGTVVAMIEGYDQYVEAGYVAEEIARLVGNGSYQPGDCAVMYRTNAQSRVLEEAFVHANLNYQIFGGIRFYERKEMRDILAYLRLILNPADRVSLERIINVPPRKIGKRTVETLQQWAATLHVSPYEALRRLAEGEQTAPFAPGPRKALLRFRETIEEFVAIRDRVDLLTLLDRLLERLTMRGFLLKEYGEEDGSERWSNVQELCQTAAEYQHLPIPDQLPAFLETIALFADLDRPADPTTDGVTCTTLHQAKGLEFPVVFLIGLEEGILPHSRSMERADAVEEERRLLYVGITRARERLYLLRAFRRARYGDVMMNEPSRFLRDIPPDLVEPVVRRERLSGTTFSDSSEAPFAFGPSRRSQGSPAWQGRSREERGGREGGGSITTTLSGSTSVPEIRFGAGQRVRHQNYGEGVVVSSRQVIGDEEVLVNFHDHGQKRMLASFAHLERIE